MNKKIIVNFLKEHVPEGQFKEFLKYTKRKFFAAEKILTSSIGDDFRFYHDFLNHNTELRFTSGKLAGVNISFPNIDRCFLFEIPLEFKGYFHDSIYDRGGVVVDAGAFPGDFSLALSQKFPQNKVLALEPDPLNREKLEYVFKANNASSRISLFPYALSDRSSSAMIYSDGTISRMITDVRSAYMLKVFPIRTITLDDLLQKQDAFTDHKNLVVKMDIEGHEIEAWRGAQKTLEAGATFVIAAYHMIEGKPTAETLTPLFHEKGYQTKLINPEHLTLIAYK